MCQKQYSEDFEAHLLGSEHQTAVTRDDGFYRDIDSELTRLQIQDTVEVASDGSWWSVESEAESVNGPHSVVRLLALDQTLSRL